MSLEFLQKERLHTGFGQEIINPTSYEDVLFQAGLDYRVDIHPAYAEFNGRMIEVPHTNVIVRDEDEKPLGIVSDKYQPVQNDDAFKYAEVLFNNEQIEFIRGGSYNGGKATWLEAKVQGKYSILGDAVESYFVMMNSHDGKGSIKAMMMPIRVACSNALNLPCGQRVWRSKHMGDPLKKFEDAQEVLLVGSTYLDTLTKEIEILQGVSLDGRQLNNIVEALYPITDEMTEVQKETMREHRENCLDVYYNKADLFNFARSGYRLVSAVADYEDHRITKNTKNGALNRYIATANGNPVVDKAFRLVHSLTA